MIKPLLPDYLKCTGIRSDCTNRNVLLPRENPVLRCEWRPPEDVPIESPPVEYPPGMPEEEPFIPEAEPLPPPVEVPREKSPVTNHNCFIPGFVNGASLHHFYILSSVNGASLHHFSRCSLARNNTIKQKNCNYVRG